ncbi:hypothetical protein FB451DRAFT_1189876 [Mycena latifolia]|nr:hypothetical protein FB451DRAFT_1189876 [Mycena latifolia]
MFNFKLIFILPGVLGIGLISKARSGYPHRETLTGNVAGLQTASGWTNLYYQDSSNALRYYGINGTFTAGTLTSDGPLAPAAQVLSGTLIAAAGHGQSSNIRGAEKLADRHRSATVTITGHWSTNGDQRVTVAHDGQGCVPQNQWRPPDITGSALPGIPLVPMKYSAFFLRAAGFSAFLSAIEIQRFPPKPRRNGRRHIIIMNSSQWVPVGVSGETRYAVRQKPSVIGGGSGENDAVTRHWRGTDAALTRTFPRFIQATFSG